LVHYPVESICCSPAQRVWQTRMSAPRSHMEVLMSGQHFRFLHAGGFLLDQPLCGLVEIPEPLTDLLIDAPFAAAQRVFDAAVEERVDFVVLNGDLIDLARPSARALAFLLDQFDRLDGHGISV